MKDFTDKVVVITGAAGGIGKALCHHFAHLGAKIAALDISDSVHDLADTMRGQGVEISAAVADIADPAAVNKAMQGLVAELGVVNVLINNAGFVRERRLDTTTAEGWAQELTGNLSGAYHCTAAVIAGMKDNKCGVIVNIGSINGLTTLGHPAYSAAKAGLESYTKTLAVEYGRFGIRANLIAPASVRTPTWDKRIAADPTVLDDLIKWYPLQRIIDPMEIAQTAAFLASDNASAITGVTLPVDCGLLAGNMQLLEELTAKIF